MEIFARSNSRLYISINGNVESILINSIPFVKDESEANNLLAEMAYDDYAEKYHQDYLNSLEESSKS